MVYGRKRARLDIALTQRKMTISRSQSENLIRLGKVTVDGRVIMKSGHFVGPNAEIKLLIDDQYVSRAGLKLESVADILKINFRDKIVLDVGSSTGGFTDYALRHGAKKVYAVDVGTDQLHPSLRHDKRIELHEKTDIRDVFATSTDHLPSNSYPIDRVQGLQHLINDIPDIIVIDVSFISLREILPHIYNHLSNRTTQIVAMVKPQFEVYAENDRSIYTERSRSTNSSTHSTHSTSSGLPAGSGIRSSRSGENMLSKGIIKNDSMRRHILRDFEEWSRKYFVIVDKRDSDVAGAKGNQERFYLLTSTNPNPNPPL